MAEVEEPIVDTPEEVEETVEVEEEEDFVQIGTTTEIKLFGKWSFDDIEVRDISLVVRNSSAPSPLLMGA
jgi:small subunit ribosomal protein S5e